MITIPNPRRIAAINFSKRSVNFIMVSFYPVYLSPPCLQHNPCPDFYAKAGTFQCLPKNEIAYCIVLLLRSLYRTPAYTSLLLHRRLHLFVILFHTLPQSVPIRIKNDLCSPVFCSSFLSRIICDGIKFSFSCSSESCRV